MWITINDNKRINTDDIKEVIDGPARIFSYSQQTGRHEITNYFNTSANGIRVVMKDGRTYTSIDDAANRNRRSLRNAGVLE
jgi:hypothetical protein